MKRKYFLLLLIMFVVFVFTGCKNGNKVKLVEGVDYFIRGKFMGDYLDISKRGYYMDIINQDNAQYIIICMGSKNMGGYSLKIKEVNKIGKRTEVIVEEIVPEKHGLVTMAFTYPTITLEFSKHQENIIIKNTKGEEFIKLKDY